MYASDYLRAKFQSDRQLAIYTQNGFTNTMQAARGLHLIFILVWNELAGTQVASSPDITMYVRN